LFVASAFPLVREEGKATTLLASFAHSGKGSSLSLISGPGVGAGQNE